MLCAKETYKLEQENYLTPIKKEQVELKYPIKIGREAPCLEWTDIYGGNERLAYETIGHNIMVVNASGWREPMRWTLMVDYHAEIGQLKEKVEELETQLENLDLIIQERDGNYILLLNMYVESRLSHGDNIINIMFDLYSVNLVSISEVKNWAKIDQHEFMEVLAKKQLNLNYPQEVEISKEKRLEKARKLL